MKKKNWIQCLSAKKVKTDVTKLKSGSYRKLECFFFYVTEYTWVALKILFLRHSGLRYSLFWGFAQCKLVSGNRRLGTHYQRHLQSVRCTETSVTNCQLSPRNTAEERRRQQHRGGSQKPHCVGSLHRLLQRYMHSVLSLVPVLDRCDSTETSRHFCHTTLRHKPKFWYSPLPSWDPKSNNVCTVPYLSVLHSERFDKKLCQIRAEDVCRSESFKYLTYLNLT